MGLDNWCVHPGLAENILHLMGSRKSTTPTIHNCWLVTPLPHLNNTLLKSKGKKNHHATSYCLKGESLNNDLTSCFPLGAIFSAHPRSLVGAWTWDVGLNQPIRFTGYISKPRLYFVITGSMLLYDGSRSGLWRADTVTLVYWTSEGRGTCARQK